MIILVTGATGFVGQHVVGQLLAQGHQVVASATDSEKASRHHWFSQVKFVAHSIGPDTNERDLFAYFGRPDVLIHLAWPDVDRPQAESHIEQHLFHQFSFLQNMLDNGLQRLTVAGTCFEYGMQSGPLNETLPTAPVTPYGLAKDSLRKFLEVRQQTRPFALTWLRLFYMYGEGQHPNALLSQLERAIQQQALVFNMSGGEQLRDYLPIGEVASLICRLATKESAAGVLNCCSGSPVSVRRLIEDYIQQRRAHLSLNLGYYPYRDFEPMAFWGTTDKLKQVLANG